MAGYWSNKRVLVPGGAGFIGSYLVEKLASEGAFVTVVDDLSSGNWSRLAKLGDSIERVDGDITNPKTQDSLLPKKDVVMNLAGVALGLTLDEERHERLYTGNLKIADAVLTGVVRHGVPRLLVVSSSCVYPDDAPIPTPEMDLHGTTPEAVNLGYGLAKREIEARAIQAAEENPEISFAIARPFNAYGARDHRRGPGAHVIPSLLEKVLSPAKEIAVWGSGNQTRSFIHSADLAYGMMLVTEKHAVADPVNIGDNSEVPIHQLVADLMRLSGVSKPVLFDHSKPEGALRKGADISKLRSIAPEFSPSVRWEDGLAEFVEAAITAWGTSSSVVTT